MKKIMFYINAIHDGGAERVMVNLAKYFSDNDYDTILVTSFRDKWEYPLASKVRRISLEDKEIQQSRIKRNVSRINKLRALCKVEKPDILVSFMEEPNFRAILATIGLPVKTLVSVRNDPNKEYAGKMGLIVGKILLPLADGCVFQTSDAQRWFPVKLQKKSKIIYNAVKEDFYNVERKPVRGEIVTCGRLTEQKNHAMLIDAFARVKKKYPFVTLKIYGEGDLRKELQKQIINLNLDDNVFLMGATNNVERVLGTADLFVLSSDYEGMPNALMEAMAVGVPCVSTDCPCGGPRDLLGDNSTNKLVQCGNVNQMADSICNYFENKEDGTKEKKMSLSFKPEKINRMWENFVLEIID